MVAEFEDAKSEPIKLIIADAGSAAGSGGTALASNSDAQARLQSSAPATGTSPLLPLVAALLAAVGLLCVGGVYANRRWLFR